MRRCKYRTFMKVKPNYGAYTHKAWSVPEERKMLALLREGWTEVQTAILMGRSVASITTKVAYLKKRGIRP